MSLILVVDDEFGILELLEAALTDEGHRVPTATNGRVALERIRAERPDLVITDFEMPLMGGAELLQAIAADAELATIPTIVMSSLPEATVAERCPSYTAFVRKPFRIAALLELVGDLA
jgi:CheY-like chemotaxis protein